LFFIAAIDYKNKEYYCIILSVGMMFSSCVSMSKLIFNVKNPRVYSSYTEVESILESQIKKTNITDYTILYSNERWKENNPLYFFGNGNPLPRTDCGMLDYHTITMLFAKGLHFVDTMSFDYVINHLVTKDSLPFRKSLIEYDYIVVMPKTTFLASAEKFWLKDIRLSLQSDKVYYIFVNADYYIWHSSEYKIGMKIKIEK
jgi:hypothetical protein